MIPAIFYPAKASRTWRQLFLSSVNAFTLSGACLCACLQAGPASALDYVFSFSGSSQDNRPANPITVTGIVSGLVDNQDNQISGLTVNILSATNGPGSGWPVITDVYSIDGDGFDVANGQVIGVNVIYEIVSPDNVLLALGNQNGFNPFLIYQGSAGGFSNNDDNSSPSNSLVFSPVPGPLPVLGAASALGWSRHLRRRLNART